jgi:hypothetical protein
MAAEAATPREIHGVEDGFSKVSIRIGHVVEMLAEPGGG